MIERRKGTYAAAKYDDSTLEILREWLKINRIKKPTDLKKLHTTIIYSRVPIMPENQVNLSSDELKKLGWRFKPSHFEVFDSKSGDKFDGKKVLALVLEAPELGAIHQQLLNSGGTHDFPEYIPHVTLSYDFEGSVKHLVPPPIYFIPNKIYSEPLDLNWE